MKFSLHVDINLPRDKVVDLFTDPENRLEWVPDLLELEPLKGVPCQPGSQCRLVYRQGSREIEVVETVTERKLPERFVSTYTSENMVSHMISSFEDRGETTRWHTENVFSGRGMFKLLPWLIPGAFRKRTLLLMQHFKDYAETGRVQH